MPFPHPSGTDFERAVAAGADPKTVVPDDFVAVRGGTTPLDPPGTVFSASVGPTLEDAACAIPYGQLRMTTVGQIRARAGIVEWLPEATRYCIVNLQHVDIIEAGATVFSNLIPNPVPRSDRIGGKP